METWQNDLKESLRSIDEIKERFAFFVSEKCEKVLENHPIRITPHTASLIDWKNPNDPLLKMVLPTSNEHHVYSEELDDPIGDQIHSPVPFMTHRYTNRVLIHTTTACAQNCRFCFRRCRKKELVMTPQDFTTILRYIEKHSEITEVIFSGGDPFMLVDHLLEGLLDQLHRCSQIEQIRFHTRLPVVLPTRFTETLLGLLKKQGDQKRVSVVVHINHAQELSDEVVGVLQALQEVVMELKTQTVLLKGVNDSVDTLSQLFDRLNDLDIPPYYLHQLDLAKQTNHFRVSLETGKEIMQALKQKNPNTPLPKYVLDIPSGGGKIPVESDQVVRCENGRYELTDRFGEKHLYQEPILISNETC